MCWINFGNLMIYSGRMRCEQIKYYYLLFFSFLVLLVLAYFVWNIEWGGERDAAGTRGRRRCLMAVNNGGIFWQVEEEVDVGGLRVEGVSLAVRFTIMVCVGFLWLAAPDNNQTAYGECFKRSVPASPNDKQKAAIPSSISTLRLPLPDTVSSFHSIWYSSSSTFFFLILHIQPCHSLDYKYACLHSPKRQ